MPLKKFFVSFIYSYIVMNDDTQVQEGATYQPLGVPAAVPHKSGKTQGIVGLVSGTLSLIFFPPILGFIGILLGVFSYKKGEHVLGLTAIVVSTVCMLAGMALAVFIFLNPDLFELEASIMGALPIFLK